MLTAVKNNPENLMVVFIGNIPGETSLLEIQQLVGNREMAIDFSTHHINCIDGVGYHYVLAKAHSDESASALIEMLNDKEFNGAQLEARLFVKREQELKWQGTNRRVSELPFDIK